MFTTLRRRVLLVAAATLSVSTLVLTAPSAMAASGPGDRCPAGSFCLFQFEDFYGDVAIFPGDGPYTRCDFRRLPSHGTTVDFDNKASSMRNRTNRTIRLYNGYGCTGSKSYSAQPGTEDKSFVNNDFDNRASGLNMPGRP